MKEVEVATVYWVDQLLTCPQMSHTFPRCCLKALHIYFIVICMYYAISIDFTKIYFSPTRRAISCNTITTKSSDASQMESRCFYGRKKNSLSEGPESLIRQIHWGFWLVQSYLGSWKEENVWQAVKLKNTNSCLDLELINLVELIRI